MDVGSIVATLSLKKGEWDASIKAVKQDNKDLGGFVLNNEKAFRDMGKAITLAGMAIVGSIGLMIKNYVDAGSAVWDLSLKTGFSTIALSELRYVAEMTGTSLDAIEVAAKKMASSITDAGLGSKTATTAFAELKIPIEDLKAMKPEDQFFAIAEALGNVEDPTLRSSLAVDIFGKSGTDILPMLSSAEGGLTNLRKEAHTLGVVFDTEAAKAADDFGDAQVRLKKSIEGLGISISQNLLPPLITLIGKITIVTTDIKDWAKEHPGLTILLTKTGLAIGGLMMVLGPLMIALPSIIKSFGLLKLAMLPIGTAVMIIGTAIGGWNLGKWIGEIQLFGTSINTYMTENFSKLIGVLGLYKGEAELTKDSTEGLRIRQELLAVASKIAGTEITNIGTAMGIVRGEYEKSGTVGNKTLDDWAKKSKNADETAHILSITVKQQKGVVDEHSKSVGVLARELEEAKKKLAATKTELGITFTSDTRDKIDKIKDALVKYKRQLDPASEIKLRKELWELKDAAVLASGKFGIFSGNLVTFTRELELGTDAVDDFYKSAVGAFQIVEDVAFNEAADQVNNFKWAVEKTGPALTTFGKTSSETTKDVKGYFDGLYNDIARGLGDMIQKWFEGGVTLRDFIGGIFESIKTTFFRIIGEMIAEWLLNFCFNLGSGISKAAKTGSDAISGIASTSKSASIAAIGFWAGFALSVSKVWDSISHGSWEHMGICYRNTYTTIEAMIQEWHRLGIEIDEVVHKASLMQPGGGTVTPTPGKIIKPKPKPGGFQYGGYVEETGLTLLHKGEFVIPPRELRPNMMIPAPVMAGSNIRVNINGPLVSTTGLSRRELETAGEKMLGIIEYQLKRLGR